MVDTLTLINNGTAAWEVTTFSGAGITTQISVTNPDIELTSIGTRYEITNDGYPDHPLEFLDDQDNALLSQSTTGSFELDSGVNWVDNDTSVEFTLTQGLSNQLTTYRCTVHIGAMVGNIISPEIDYTPDTGSVSITSPAEGDVVTSPFDVVMSATDFNVEAASNGPSDGAGHFHILVDQPAVAPGQAIPNNPDDGYYHYGDGSTTATLDLGPGATTIRIQAGTSNHLAYDLTDSVNIIVESDIQGTPIINAIDNVNQTSLNTVFAAIAADPTARDNLSQSDRNIDTVSTNVGVIEALNNNEEAIRKMLCRREGRDPANFADLDAVAADQGLMQSIAARQESSKILARSQKAASAASLSQTAMQELATSQTASEEIAASPTSMQEMESSQLARDEIVSSGASMNAMINSSTAMQIIRSSSSFDLEFHDSSLYTDALESAASISLGVSGNIEDLVGSSGDMTTIADSQTAIQQISSSSRASEAIANSQTAINKISNSQTAINEIVDSQTAMQEISNSSLAMETLGSTTNVIQAFSNSTIAMNNINNNDFAVRCIMCGVTSLDPNDFNSAADIAQNQSAMSTIADSPETMEVVAASQAALSAIGNDPVVENTVYNSNVAIGALNSSPLKQSRSRNINVIRSSTLKSDRSIALSHSPGRYMERSNQPQFGASENSFPHTADRILSRNDVNNNGRANTSASWIDI
jgi:hypothetical protein